MAKWKIATWRIEDFDKYVFDYLDTPPMLLDYDEELGQNHQDKRRNFDDKISYLERSSILQEIHKEKLTPTLQNLRYISTLIDYLIRQPAEYVDTWKDIKELGTYQIQALLLELSWDEVVGHTLDGEAVAGRQWCETIKYLFSGSEFLPLSYKLQKIWRLDGEAIRSVIQCETMGQDILGLSSLQVGNKLFNNSTYNAVRDAILKREDIDEAKTADKATQNESQTPNTHRIIDININLLNTIYKEVVLGETGKVASEKSEGNELHYIHGSTKEVIDNNMAINLQKRAAALELGEEEIDINKITYLENSRSHTSLEQAKRNIAGLSAEEIAEVMIAQERGIFLGLTPLQVYQGKFGPIECSAIAGVLSKMPTALRQQSLNDIYEQVMALANQTQPLNTFSQPAQPQELQARVWQRKFIAKAYEYAKAVEPARAAGIFLGLTPLQVYQGKFGPIEYNAIAGVLSKMPAALRQQSLNDIYKQVMALANQPQPLNTFSQPAQPQELQAIVWQRKLIAEAYEDAKAVEHACTAMAK